MLMRDMKIFKKVFVARYISENVASITLRHFYFLKSPKDSSNDLTNLLKKITLQPKKIWFPASQVTKVRRSLFTLPKSKEKSNEDNGEDKDKDRAERVEEEHIIDNLKDGGGGGGGGGEEEDSNELGQETAGDVGSDGEREDNDISIGGRGKKNNPFEDTIGGSGNDEEDDDVSVGGVEGDNLYEELIGGSKSDGERGGNGVSTEGRGENNNNRFEDIRVSGSDGKRVGDNISTEERGGDNNNPFQDMQDNGSDEEIDHHNINIEEEIDEEQNNGGNVNQQVEEIEEYNDDFDDDDYSRLYPNLKKYARHLFKYYKKKNLLPLGNYF